MSNDGLRSFLRQDPKLKIGRYHCNVTFEMEYEGKTTKLCSQTKSHYIFPGNCVCLRSVFHIDVTSIEPADDKVTSTEPAVDKVTATEPPVDEVTRQLQKRKRKRKTRSVSLSESCSRDQDSIFLAFPTLET